MGDLTTALIQHKLDGTHLESHTTRQSVVAALYTGTNYIQLSLTFDSNKEAIILRRVEDLYININQLLSVLVDFELLLAKQVDNFIEDEIILNPMYKSDGINQFIDSRQEKNNHTNGVWISYDKAVGLAYKFDLYELVKRLFLIDVHEFDKLPNANKRIASEDDEEMVESPTKRLRKESKLEEPPKLVEEREMEKLVAKMSQANTNLPFSQSPVNQTDDELSTELKGIFGDCFKLDADEATPFTFDAIKRKFEPIIAKFAAGDQLNQMDIALDAKGQTALHFAATLASTNLVKSFIKLGLNLPARGNLAGESPLISTIQVTNSMEKGNFGDLLRMYLWPGLWLFDRKRQTVLHHLAVHARKQELTKFYTTKIIEYVATDDKRLKQFLLLVNAQDEENGDTALHHAVEQELRWLVRLLLTLRADPLITNNKGVKPLDFELVQAVQNEDVPLEYMFDLLITAIELLDRRVTEAKTDEIADIDEPVQVAPKKEDESVVDPKKQALAKIFKLIQDLLTNTNLEYELILNTKREQIKALNQLLHDLTIVTANNRYLLKQLTMRLQELDNLKLQMSNIQEKLLFLKLEVKQEPETDGIFNADEPFIILNLYDAIKRGELVDNIKPENVKLQPIPILKARIAAYKQINHGMEKELQDLRDYLALTAKFKKVVLVCTGVGINEVDDLLDGLLEAVESQQ